MLLLDELDSTGKRRDDATDVGELICPPSWRTDGVRKHDAREATNEHGFT